MWLILTTGAATAASAVWYVNAPEDKYKVGLLSLALWGATVMWSVDHVMAYLTDGGRFFEFGRDATALGVSTIVLALLVWLLVLLISDPKGVLRRTAQK